MRQNAGSANVKDEERTDKQDVEELLDVLQVAALLGVSTTTVYKMIHDGLLRCVYIGRLVRIRPSDYEELLEKSSNDRLIGL